MIFDAFKRVLGIPTSQTVLASCRAFATASANWSEAYKLTEVFSEHAHNRQTLLLAQIALQRGPADDDLDAHYAKYDKTAAMFQDRFDFKPYTSEYLNDHGAAFDQMVKAFERFVETFAELKSLSRWNRNAAESLNVFNLTCDLCTTATEGYERAGWCANLNLLEAKCAIAKDEYHLTNFEIVAARPIVPDGAKEAADAFRLKLEKLKSETELLETLTSAATSHAESFLIRIQAAREVFGS